MRVRSLIFAVCGSLVLLTGAVVWAMSGGKRVEGSAVWMAGSPSRPPAPKPGPMSVTIAAVGDIILGNMPGPRDPARIPPNNGTTYFDSVKTLLVDADFTMGNMEQPITEDTGYTNCRPTSTSCHQYRVPPSYAPILKNAGFDLINIANNHGYDYGSTGYANTQSSLTDAGLAFCGPRDRITVVTVNGIKIAVLGFSSYGRDNSLLDFNQAKQIVAQAATMADLVVIQVHWGAEGMDKAHVRPGTEMFVGENRGDPMKFSRTVIDAGADLIIGHGPHTLRAMEFYKGRLIAYSLGNFGGGGILNSNKSLGWSGVLKVTLNADGSFVSGRFASTSFVTHPGLPTIDTANRGLGLLRTLTKEDFPDTGALIDAQGAIGQPT